MTGKCIRAIKEVLRILNSRQRVLGLFVLIASFIGALLETLGVSAVTPLVSVLLQPEVLMQNEIVSGVVEKLHIETRSGLVLSIGTAVIFLYIVKNIYFIFLSWLKIKYACKVQREISVQMMKSYMGRGYEYFLQKNISELMQGVSGDVAHVYQVILNSLKMAVDFLTVILICVYMCYADWKMALGVMVLGAVCLVLIYIIFHKAMVRNGLEYRKYHIKSNQAMLQAFHGIKEVIVMRKQRYFIEAYERNVTKRQNAQIGETVGGESPAYIIEGICISGILAIVCVRIARTSDPENFVAILASFAVGAFRILPSLGKISSAMNAIIASIPGVESVYENMIEAQKYNSEFFKVELDGQENSESIEDILFQDVLQIQDVTFAYNSETGNVLDHLDLKIPKGKSIALIGQSGAGKSTLVDIILGLLVPDNGKVLLDGIDIRTIPDTWSRMVGYVPQSIYLSDDSIKANIAFGVAEEDIDEELVYEALKEAELDEFVAKLPQGLDTVVGDRGVRLSGGQRQRIAIARALYHNPEILILDEATSALDNETETAVMEAIDSLHGKVTLVIVAHRLTTIRNCDEIFEIGNGIAVQRNKGEVLA